MIPQKEEMCEAPVLSYTAEGDKRSGVSIIISLPKKLLNTTLFYYKMNIYK